MDYKELKRLLKEIVGSKMNLPFQAVVKKVDGDTCDIQINDLVIPDVLLKSTSDGAQNFLLLKPKVNSMVTVLSLTGELTDLTVIKVNEIESIEYIQNGLHVLIDSQDKKVMIKNNQTSLVDLFSDLKSLLSSFKVIVPTPGGPAPSLSIEPQSILNLTQFEVKFKQLLK
jgi:hypothetical protein